MSPRRSGVSRRKLLMGIGAGLFSTGVLTSTGDTGAFTSVNANRTTNVSVASDPGNALAGIVGQGPVKKNERAAMVEFTNNAEETMTITVTLNTASEGTLYDNEGGSGSSVTLTLASGNAQFVDISAAVTGTIGYSVSASTSSLNIDTAGAVESESGNVKGAVRLKKPSKDQDFTANNKGNSNQFEVKSVDIEDNDGDDDLDRIEFRVREGGSSGTVVGSLDVDNPPGGRYKPNGNPAVVVQPNSGYTIKNNTTYALTVTGYDADGNFTSQTVEDIT